MISKIKRKKFNIHNWTKVYIKKRKESADQPLELIFNFRPAESQINI